MTTFALEFKFSFVIFFNFLDFSFASLTLCKSGMGGLCSEQKLKVQGGNWRKYKKGEVKVINNFVLA